MLGILILAAANIDLINLIGYSTQTHPTYITKNNTPNNNPITDKGATLGGYFFTTKNCR